MTLLHCHQDSCVFLIPTQTWLTQAYTRTLSLNGQDMKQLTDKWKRETQCVYLKVCICVCVRLRVSLCVWWGLGSDGGWRWMHLDWCSRWQGQHLLLDETESYKIQHFWQHGVKLYLLKTLFDLCHTCALYCESSGECLVNLVLVLSQILSMPWVTNLFFMRYSAEYMWCFSSSRCFLRGQSTEMFDSVPEYSICCTPGVGWCTSTDPPGALTSMRDPCEREKAWHVI